MRILGVDDNPDIAMLLSIAFNSSGHDFSYTLSGREALKLIRENKYDVVLLDLAMPEFSGNDLLNALEQEGLIGKQKIIILTASTTIDNDSADFKKMGVVECMSKPVDLDELSRKVEAIAAA
jgi:DNA-binding response OmpR family regulator